MKPQSLTLPLFDGRPASASPPSASPPSASPPPPPPPRAPQIVVPPRLRPQELWGAVRWPDPATRPALEAAARAAQGFTPRVCLMPPDALLLELRGSVALFGGLAALSARVGQQFPAATVALAPTPSAALALATAGKRCCLTDPARFVSRLAPLPLSCLRWPPETLARLASMGLHRIGEVLRLPRAGFAQRFGTPLLEALDRLTGRRPDPGATFVPVPRFRARCEPAFEPAAASGILRVIEPLLASLEAFLRERQRGITALRLTLEHRAHPPTHCVLRLAMPEQSAATFARLLAIRLERLPLPAPARRCALQSGPLLEQATPSGGLWRPGEQGGGGAERLPAFLEQLRARLGDGAVQGIRLLPGHRPERLTRPVPPASAPAAVPGGTRRGLRRGRQREPALVPPWAQGMRPLWLLRDPRPLDRAADGSGHPGEGGRRFTLLAGPERIETGWWDEGDVARDYYIAADADGARLWIFRERGGRGGWFVHGYF